MSELRRYSYALHWLIPRLLLRGWEMREPIDIPQAGDLVILSAAPLTEWDISIYKETGADGRDLLESLKTGKLCWWSNVGFHVIDRKWVSEFDRILWIDGKFKISDWFNRAHRQDDYYIILPFIQSIDDENLVIGTRVRYGFTSERTASSAIPWKKLKYRELRALIAAQVKDHESASRKAEPPVLGTEGNGESGDAAK